MYRHGVAYTSLSHPVQVAVHHEGHVSSLRHGLPGNWAEVYPRANSDILQPVRAQQDLGWRGPCCVPEGHRLSVGVPFLAEGNAQPCGVGLMLNPGVPAVLTQVAPGHIYVYDSVHVLTPRYKNRDAAGAISLASLCRVIE